MTPFIAISYLTDKKVRWEDLTTEEQKAFNPFMVNRILSMSPEYLELINYVQQYTKLGNEYYYKLLFSELPKKKIFAKYIKSENKDRWNSELVAIVATYLNLTKSKTYSALETLLETNQLKSFVKEMGYTDKEVEKLIKTK